MQADKYLITGATGQTGSVAVAVLLESGKQVRAMAHRSDERSEHLQQLGAEVVYGDLDDYQSLKAATHGIRGAYFCYPIAEGIVQATAQFAQAAKDNGVEAIVNMSQVIAREDAKSPASFQHWLSERVFDWSGLPTTHIRPTFFAEWLLLFAPMIREGKMLAPYAKGKTALIAAEDQGHVIACILQNPKPHRGKTYSLYGAKEYSFAEIASEVGRVLNKPIDYQQIPIEAMMQGFVANRPAVSRNDARTGYAESNGLEDFTKTHIFLHLREAVNDFENGLFGGMNDIVERITKRSPMTIEDFILKHRVVFS